MCHHLLTLMLFQTCMRFFQLSKTKEDILKNVGNQPNSWRYPLTFIVWKKNTKIFLWPILLSILSVFYNIFFHFLFWWNLEVSAKASYIIYSRALPLQLSKIKLYHTHLHTQPLTPPFPYLTPPGLTIPFPTFIFWSWVSFTESSTFMDVKSSHSVPSSTLQPL